MPRSAGDRGRTSPGAEGVGRRRLERLPGPQHGRGEVRLVRRIREVLRLESEGVALPVGLVADAPECAVEEVAAVELRTGLGRAHGDRPATLRLPEFSGEP